MFFWWMYQISPMNWMNIMMFMIILFMYMYKENKTLNFNVLNFKNKLKKMYVK